MVAASPTSLAIPARADPRSLFATVGLGMVMLMFVAAGPWIERTAGYGLLIPCIAASGILTIVATLLAPVVPQRAGLLVILGLALAMRLVSVFQEPLLSTDIYRYVWDGRVQAAGINPYLYVPADPALAALRDSDIYPHINRADYALTAYPPVAQMFFFVVTRISETLTAMRLGMVACEIVIIAIMIDVLRRLELPVAAVVAWAWHPLAIWEIANNGHVDALMVALLMLGIWYLLSSRTLAGTAAAALAALVKPYAIIVLPAFWRRSTWRLAPVFVAVVALCYLPYLGAGSRVLGYVTSGYVSEEGLASGEGFWLVTLVQAVIGKVSGLTAAYFLVALGVMGVLAVRAFLRDVATPQLILQDIAMLLMAGLFFLSPHYPWYFLAVVPFTVLGGGAAAWVMTLATILLYSPVMLPHHDLAWSSIAYLPFVAVSLAAVLRAGAFTRIHRASQWTT